MARRSSARLRGRNSSSTPKRVSLSHDAQPQTPRTAPVKLTTLKENDEMPGSFPASASPPSRFAMESSEQNTATAPVNFNAGTPTNVTPIKPTEEETHPKQHRQSTAKPLEEARWLGFSNMHPQTEPPKQSSKIATTQGTPTKASKSGNGMESPRFRFTFNREQSLELSPAAKRLMEETREEAAKIRDQMIASGEAAQDAEMAARKIATPKSRKGRFSDAHKADFNKMGSIASHHSVRSTEKGPLNISINTPGQKNAQKNVVETSPTKSLKRKQSRAELDEPDRYNVHNMPRSILKPTAPSGTSALPRPTSTNNLISPSKSDLTSTPKRAKYSAADTPSRGRTQPSTPHTSKATPREVHYPDLSNLASPTQASLARTASVKFTATSKIPAPNLVHSPSKPALHATVPQSPKLSTPLLARSPAKATLFQHGTVNAPTNTAESAGSPLLQRSPTKAGGPKKSPDDNQDKVEPRAKQEPLLSRSPMKVSVVRNAESQAEEPKPVSSTPLLHRSPAKISITSTKQDGKATGTPSKASENGLLGRFNLLRASPMKSILRSPQRLYSTDPAKVAAGTHLATPPKFPPKVKAGATKESTPAPKHVDFSSSTKARYERAQSELSSTPSKGPTPSPKKPAEESSKSPTPTFAAYPALPMDSNDVVMTPQKRRQTAVPGDFTFKAGEHSISFGQSPNAPASAAGSKRPSTIRHVSAEPTNPPASTTKKRKFEYENAVAAAEEEEKEVVVLPTTTKKRKFEFENAVATGEEEKEAPGTVSDKENEEVERPAKRVKKSAPEPASTKAAAKPAPTKRPTLGVKPKKAEGAPKEKKPSVISKARLNALSQPKRRG